MGPAAIGPRPDGGPHPHKTPRVERSGDGNTELLLVMFDNKRFYGTNGGVAKGRPPLRQGA